MLKKIWNTVYDFVWKRSKWMLPLLLIVVVAIVVAVALKAKDAKEQVDAVQGEQGVAENMQDPSQEVLPEPTPDITQVALVENTNEALHTLICEYYNAYASGDMDTIKRISNYVKDTDEITIPEMSIYVESYPELKIYTKEGPLENSYLAYVYFKMKVTGFDEAVSGMETFYVCTDDSGTLYINKGEASQEELEYIQTVSLQEDVVELYNRVTVECSDTFANNAELYYYIQEIVNEVQKNTGEQLAQGISGEYSGDENGAGETGDVPPQEGTGDEPVTGGEETVYDGPIYAKATTTVNVRSSDSEQADKVDKVTSGTKVEVLEQRVNGWTKVKVNEKEGFIKSEFLNVITVVNPGNSIGQVTATSNVNVRAAASQDAERLGLLTGGTTVELLENLGEWSKINYNGQVGYVKSEFLQ